MYVKFKTDFSRPKEIMYSDHIQSYPRNAKSYRQFSFLMTSIDDSLCVIHVLIESDRV